MKTINDIIHNDKSTIAIKNSKGQDIYCEDLYGNWAVWEYSELGDIVYFENNAGFINDNRP